jgi:hypothetical protein
MDKKTLRKELESALIKSMEETLNKRNAIAGKKIKKKTEAAAKTVAKKFYKAIKELSEKKVPAAKTDSKNTSTIKAPVKKTAKKTVAKRKK